MTQRFALLEVAIPLPDCVETTEDVQQYLREWLDRAEAGCIRQSDLPQDGERCH